MGELLKQHVESVTVCHEEEGGSKGIHLPSAYCLQSLQIEQTWTRN